MGIKSKMSLLIIFIMIASVAFSGCSDDTINVNVKSVQKKPLEAFVSAGGTVEAENIEEDYFDKGTKIDNVYVKVGDEVTEEQKIVQYNGDKIKQSTMDGVVTQVNVKKGMTVDFNMPAIVIMDETKLIIKADVRQSDIPNVQQGQEVLISSDVLPKERNVIGKVEEISNAAKKSGTSEPTFGVKIRIDGQVPEVLKAGMSINCQIKVSHKDDALVITYESVKISGDDKNVFVVKNGKLEERKVVLGASYGMYVEVKSGLSEGEKVVIDPKPNYTSGMLVTVSTQ